jgi:hypothetical protein
LSAGKAVRAAGSPNPLKRLKDCGQSVWLDYIRRDFIVGGELRRLVEQDGIAGVTSNPTIFEKAIAASADYDDALRAAIASRPDSSPEALFEMLAVEDVQMAADVLRPVYDATDGADGFVSIEVSPRGARSTSEAIEEARRLWQEVNRPNLMVKVPSSVVGIPAVEALIAEGINVNITLMFSMRHYEAVARPTSGGSSAPGIFAGSRRSRRSSSVASIRLWIATWRRWELRRLWRSEGRSPSRTPRRYTGGSKKSSLASRSFPSSGEAPESSGPSGRARERRTRRIPT